jgi:hypothetical protein
MEYAQGDVWFHRTWSKFVKCKIMHLIKIDENETWVSSALWLSCMVVSQMDFL